MSRRNQILSTTHLNGPPIIERSARDVVIGVLERKTQRELTRLDNMISHYGWYPSRPADAHPDAEEMKIIAQFNALVEKTEPLRARAQKLGYYLPKLVTVEKRLAWTDAHALEERYKKTALAKERRAAVEDALTAAKLGLFAEGADMQAIVDRFTTTLTTLMQGM